MNRRFACLLSFFLAFAVQLAPMASSAEEVKKVAILPFNINSEKDLSFLREGIQDMLASRLYWKGKVEVLEKGMVRKAMGDYRGSVDSNYATKLGRELGADYVLFGSTTVFGDSVSLDATMFNLKKEEPPVTLFTQTKGMESVIPEINQFAQNVNARIFGRGYAETETASVQPAGAIQPGTPRAAVPGPSDERVSSLNPQFRQFHQVDVEGESFWRSRILDTEIHGMDIGDVDGDGRNEVALLEGTDITVNRFENGALKQLATYPSDDRSPFVSIDVADMDGNGRAEIYASRQSGNNISSVVLDMDGGRLKARVKHSSWLFRVVDWPGRGRILIGQEKRPGWAGGSGLNLIKNFFSPGIYSLKWNWNGSELEKAESAPLLDLPNVYVYNFAVGDLNGDSNPEIVTIDLNGKLHLLDSKGEEFYKTSDYYGGTLTFLTTGLEENNASGMSDRRILDKDYIYIPARILITDLDQNGKKEIIINQNSSLTGGLTERFRTAKDGKIVSLSWNGLSLEPNWESRKLPGCLSDYQVKDLENTGKPSLVVGVIQSQAISAFKDARSIVVSYRLTEKGS